MNLSFSWPRSDGRALRLRRSVLVGLFVLGCGSGSPSGTGTGGSKGTGGHPGTGGAAGGTGTGGAAGGTGAGGAAGAGAGGTAGSGGAPNDAGGIPSCYAPCIEDLLARCPSAGQTCTQGTSGTSTVKCYGDGVKDLINAAGTMATRLNANGAVCLTVMATAQYEDYYDAQGNYAGRVADTSSSLRFQVTCADGTSSEADFSTAACAPYAAEQTEQCPASSSCTD
ncbi:MAG TPA: hypothetical protein VHO06_23885 [Polyangia bacterium]|nr:hypothetical protein [Polyangia bacterium]